MFSFLLGPYFARQPSAQAVVSEASARMQPVSKPERLAPQELEELFIREMVQAFHSVPLEKEVISGTMDSNLARGSIRAYAIRAHSQSSTGRSLITITIGSKAHLSAHNPALTGTTLYSPVLTNSDHGNQWQGKQWRSSSFLELERSQSGARSLAMNDFQVVRCLGRGSYGQVYLVHDKVSQQLLAMKVIENTRLATEKYGRIFEEQRIGRELTDSRWSLGIEGSFHDSNNFYILSKYCSGGDLRHAIFNDSEFFAQHNFKLMIAELILAIEELHNRRMIHRDIKLENILIDEHDHLILADFGISKSFGATSNDRPWEAYPRWRKASFAHRTVKRTALLDQGGDMTCWAGGTPGYSAPEMFSGFYSYEVDVWAAGIVVYLSLFGCYPFGINPHEQNMIEVMQRTQSLCLDFPVEDRELCPRAKDLVQRMLEKDPRKRMTIEQIKTHSFFRSVNWAHVALRQNKTKRPRIASSLRSKEVTEPDLAILAGQLYVPGSAPYPWFDYTSPTLQPQYASYNVPTTSTDKFLDVSIIYSKIDTPAVQITPSCRCDQRCT